MTENLNKTPLYDLHVAAQAKMVPFAGYSMPVQYGGIMQEHLHCRTKAALFDVSHMGQVVVTGDKEHIACWLESLTPSSLQILKENRMRYSLLLNEVGGIIDDLMITHRPEDFLIVINAACKEKDLAHLQKNLPQGVSLQYLENQGLLALQGPKAEEVMRLCSPIASQLSFMTGCFAEIGGISCYITRSGYTGEDGFEISVAGAQAAALAQHLLQNELVAWAGLGARDTLRLEAGLCLYGHDLNEETTPIEANLAWVVGMSRREKADFPAARKILDQLAQGASHQRIGLLGLEKAPVREGAVLENEAGSVVGYITSGTFSPSLQKPIAMGYVEREAAVETVLYAAQRGKRWAMHVTEMPFVQQQYKK